jgi:ketosteroid isomerase-like protein
MKFVKTETMAEAEVRVVLEHWANAVRSRDIHGIVAHYAPDIVAFDAIAQLQFKGLEAYRKHWEYCLTLCNGPTIFDAHEIKISANDELAFAYGLCLCGGTNDKGEQQSGWMRFTAAFRKLDGQWRTVHEHWSTPFDMESGKALFDLKPE